jgi:hypothetical protein
MDADDPKARYYARTMHTPDDPARARLRSSLRDLSKALIPLHRGLIDASKEDYSFANGPIENPTQLLGLLQSDPFFEWLRPITTLIVDIDEMVRTDFQTEAAQDIVTRAERMFGTEADVDFSARYIPVLQRDVDVAIGHAAVRKILAALRN